MSRSQTAPGRRALAGVLTAALIAAASVLGVAGPAAAAPADVTSSTMTWGLKQSFRNYVINMVTTDGTITTTGDAAQPGGGTNVFTWSSGAGSYDEAAGRIEVAYDGGVRFVKHAGQLDVRLANPRVVHDGTTGTLYADVTTKAYNGLPAVDETGVAFAALSGGELRTEGEVATYTDVAASLTAEGAAAFAGFYSAGQELDPLTITAPFAAAPTSTTTTLTVSPEGTAREGADVVLTAAVAPAVAGTVEFLDGEASLGAAAVSDGIATTTVATLEAGSHHLTARFTPADDAAFTPSSSEPVTYTIVGAQTEPGDVAVSAPSVAPATRALRGETVTLAVDVTGDADATAGTVEFFDDPTGPAGRVSLGTAEVIDGTATRQIPGLAAGGHDFTAVFTPSQAGLAAVESGSSGPYGIVDTATVEVAAPTAGDPVSDVTATWRWSDYAAGWTKVASGDVTVADGAFVLTGGTGIVGAEATVIRFRGTLRVEAYGTFFPPHGQWVELVDPVLTVARGGAATWSAAVRSGSGAYDSAAATTPVVVASTSAAPALDFSSGALDASISFDYEGTTAPGTWHPDYANAWPNAFVLAVPSAIQAFYFQTGDTPGNLDKPPADLSLRWTAPTEPEPEPEPTPEPTTPGPTPEPTTPGPTPEPTEPGSTGPGQDGGSLPAAGSDAPDRGGVVPTAADLTDEMRGGIRLSASSVAAGDDLTITVDTAHAGREIDALLFSAPTSLGTHTVSAAGMVTVTIPTTVAAGTHRVAVYDADGTLIGWETLTVTTDDALAATGGAVTAPLALGTLLLVAAGVLMALRRRVA